MRKKLSFKVGQRFRYLTIIKHEGGRYWLCQCDCGRETIVRGTDLKAGSTGSCGCKRTGGHSNRLPYGEGALNLLIRSMKKGAKERGYTWALTKDQVKVITKQPCTYCGSLPGQISHSKTSYGEYVYNGIDRADNSIGYTPNNSVSCCGLCNKMKSTLPLKDFLAHIREISTHNAL